MGTRNPRSFNPPPTRQISQHVGRDSGAPQEARRERPHRWKGYAPQEDEACASSLGRRRQEAPAYPEQAGPRLPGLAPQARRELPEHAEGREGRGGRWRDPPWWRVRTLRVRSNKVPPLLAK